MPPDWPPVREHRARVAAFSDDDLDELYAMRISLEALAAGIAVPRMTEEDLHRIDQLLDEMDETARTGDVEQALANHLGRTPLMVLSMASPTYEPVRVRRALSALCGR